MPNDTPESSGVNPLLMEEIPRTLVQLNAKVAELFHCMTGPPRAYFEIPLPSHDRYESGELPTERFAYTSLAWRTHGSRDSATEARLVAALLEPFIDARRQLVGDRSNSDVSKPVLFWRLSPELEDYVNHETGAKMVKIRCRVVIPGAALRAYEQIEGDLIRLL